MKQFTHIVLMGMKHTGKSTLGRLLAERIGLPFFDTDAVIAERSGKSARELFDSGGAELMMKYETDACRALAGGTASVIATGGGLADNREACEVLAKNGLIVFIDTPFDILFGRIQESARKDGRYPKFLQGDDPRGLFQEIFHRRTAIYAKIADIRIETGARMPPEIVQDITDYIEHEQRTDLHSRR
jgi:shikimate kinase